MKNLSTKHSVYYSLASLPLSAMLITIFVYLPKFLIENMSLAPAVVGIGLIIVKSFDLILDPIVGIFTDKSKQRGFGFKKFIYISFVPLSFFYLILFFLQFNTNPEVIFLFSLICFFMFYTLFDIAYQALGLELSTDYHGRTKLFSIRDALILVGTVFAAALPTFLETLKVSEIYKFQFSAIVYVLLFIISIAFLFKITEKPFVAIKTKRKSNFKNYIKNRAFNVLSINYFLTSFGSTVSGGLILIYLQYVLGVSSGSKYILIFFIFSLVGMPIWVYLSKKFDKLPVWIFAMFLTTISFFGVLFLNKGDELYYLLIICVSGLGIGGCLAIPSSMQADIAEVMSKETGVNLQASLVSFWAMIKKVSAAIAIGIAFPILEYSGFVANIEQAPATITVIKVLYAGVPLTCYCLAIAIAFFYPLSKRSFNNEVSYVG